MVDDRASEGKASRVGQLTLSLSVITQGFNAMQEMSHEACKTGVESFLYVGGWEVNHRHVRMMSCNLVEVFSLVFKTQSCV